VITYEKELKAGSESRSGSLRSQSKTTFSAAKVGESHIFVSWLRVDFSKTSNSETTTFTMTTDHWPTSTTLTLTTDQPVQHSHWPLTNQCNTHTDHWPTSATITLTTDQSVQHSHRPLTNQCNTHTNHWPIMTSLLKSCRRQTTAASWLQWHAITKHSKPMSCSTFCKLLWVSYLSTGDSEVAEMQPVCTRFHHKPSEHSVSLHCRRYFR